MLQYSSIGIIFYTLNYFSVAVIIIFFISTAKLHKITDFESDIIVLRQQ